MDYIRGSAHRRRVIASSGWTTTIDRSYIVDTSSGQVHRNRLHLNVVPTTQDVSRDPAEQETPIATYQPTVEPQETPAESLAGDHPAHAAPSSPKLIMTRSHTGNSTSPAKLARA